MIKATLTFLVCFISLQSISQRYYYTNYSDNSLEWEIGLSSGVMFGYTDVGTKKDFLGTIKTPRLFGGIYCSLTGDDTWTIRLEAVAGSITGDDKDGIHAKRNLHYITSINEISLMGEWDLSSLYSDPYMTPLIHPYIAGGFGYLHFEPYTYLNGTKIYLQPLRTEGQGFAHSPNASVRPYSLNRMNILLATGLKFDVSPTLNIRAEAMYRRSGTDYLDDVSSLYIDPALFDANLPLATATQAKLLFDRSNPRDPSYSGPGSIRGDSRDKDWYWSFNIKIGIKFSNKGYY